MAHILGRRLSVVGSNGKFLFARIVQGVNHDGLNLGRVPGQVTRVATLIATHGEKLPNHDPWPYEAKPYNFIYEYLDNTSKRINENSKVIIVEGNVGVGKNEFAKRLAKNFDMKYFPAVEEAECFGVSGLSGFDARDLNEILPQNAQFYDLKKFFSETNPKRGTIGRLQLLWFKERAYLYQKALLHLFSTGQGVVIPRSVFGENAFVDACRKMGYITPQFNKYYYALRENSICELLKPHLTIYLDAPVSTLRERISKRADPREAGSAILSDKYLENIEAAYRGKVLPKLRQSGAVVEVDWAEVADDMDMDVIVEELAYLNLETEDNEDVKFSEWKLSEDEMCHYRKVYAGRQLQILMEYFDPPFNCPEIILSGEDLAAYNKIVQEHPAIEYKAGWAEELDNKPVSPYLRVW